MVLLSKHLWSWLCMGDPFSLDKARNFYSSSGQKITLFLLSMRATAHFIRIACCSIVGVIYSKQDSTKLFISVKLHAESFWLQSARRPRLVLSYSTKPKLAMTKLKDSQSIYLFIFFTYGFHTTKISKCLHFSIPPNLNPLSDPCHNIMKCE